MTNVTGGPLDSAYEAIRANEFAKARDLLSAYLVDQPNDADAWWLYSYAVTDVDQARKALETVLRLDPAYPGARDLLTELEGMSPRAAVPAAMPAGIQPLSRQALTPTVTPDDDDIDVEFEMPEDEARPSRASASRRLLIAAVAFAVVLTLAVLIFVILPAIQTPPPATSVAGVTTESGPTATVAEFVLSPEATEVVTGAATETATEAPTVESPTDEPTVQFTVTDEPGGTVTIFPPPSTVAPVSPDQFAYDALTAFDFVPDSAETETTELGDTFTVSVCTELSQIRTVVPDALTALALVSPSASTDADALGIKFLNCADESQLRYVALTMSDALAYANGTLDSTTVRSRFVPVQAQ